MASYLDCKIKMHKYFIYLLILMLSIHKSYAQNDVYTNTDTTVKVIEEKVEVTSEEYSNENNNEVDVEKPAAMPGWGEDVLGDTSINFRPFAINNDSLNILKNSAKYEWIKTLDSTLHTLQKKQENAPPTPAKEYDNSPSTLDNFFNSSILKLFLWIIAGCFVIFIIYQLFLSKGLFGKASKRAVNEIEAEEAIDHLDNDFDKLYEKAFAAGDTRLAMRFLFLKTLQKLNDKEFIQFASDKTNSMYVKEMPQTLRNKFSQIALYYEYSWYGNVTIPTEVFDSIKNTVTTFTNNL
jgi:hypothetical protein